MTVNGSPYVGPTIFADWGDMVSITINNGLTTNGTSIHYHGMNMPNNNVNDGVNGVTECALAPGTSITHTWQATQHGTSWWHSHYTGQYAGGIQGPIVIDGPTSANYDIDLGALPLTDWQYVPAFTEAYVNEQRALNFQGILAVDNILINGTAQDGNGNGAYSTINVTAGKVHKLRLINTSVSTGLLFQIAGHSMTVVAQDFVPVTPLNVTQLSISIGQRYDVLVTADQSPGAYWVRADGDSDCQEPTNRGGRAVLVYSTSPSATPDTAEPDGANVAGTCTAPATEPVWTVTAGSLDDFTANRGYLTLTLGNQVQSHNGDFIDWYFNTTGIDINWGHPTLTYIAEGNTSYPAESAAIPLNATASGWSYWVIYELGNPGTSFIPHPLHLHGHDFWLLGQGVGAFDLATASLNFDNPLRRDTHVLQGDNHTQQGVWMAFAFRTGNPGVRILLCRSCAAPR